MRLLLSRSELVGSRLRRSGDIFVAQQKRETLDGGGERQGVARLEHRKRELKKQAMSRVAKVEAVLRDWDPLGVGPGELAPDDEYDSYAPPIVSLVNRGCTADELAEHLSGLTMADLEPRSSSRTVAERILSMLRAE